MKEKEKKYVKESAANKLIADYERNGVLPAFRDNKYDQERKLDLLNVIKEIYCIQPKIFKGLKKEQQQTCVGFLNLLLDTDEREIYSLFLAESLLYQQKNEFSYLKL